MPRVPILSLFHVREYFLAKFIHVDCPPLLLVYIFHPIRPPVVPCVCLSERWLFVVVKERFELDHETL